MHQKEYLRIHLPKESKDLSSEYCKMLMKEIKEKQSWRNWAPWLQTMLQSYSNKSSLVGLPWWSSGLDSIPMQGAQIRFLFRELDPTRCN